MERPCDHCGALNPRENTLCFICGRPVIAAERSVVREAMASTWSGAVGAALARRRRERLERADGRERTIVLILRIAFIALFIELGLSLANLPYDFLEQFGFPTTWYLLLMLGPLVGMAVCALAVWRVAHSPYAWGLVIAGLQTLEFCRAWLNDEELLLLGGQALLLWGLALLLARSRSERARALLGPGDEVTVESDLRVTLAALLGFGGVIAGVVMLSKRPYDPDDWTWLAIWYVGMAALSMMICLVARRGHLWRSFPVGLGAARWRNVFLWFGFLAVCALTLEAWSAGVLWPQPQGIGMPPVEVLVTGALLPAVFEEWLCRGALWQVLEDRLGPLEQVLAGAVLFGLLHAVDRSGVGMGVTGPQILGGLGLGGLRYSSGSLLPCIAAHFLWNGYVYSTPYAA